MDPATIIRICAQHSIRTRTFRGVLQAEDVYSKRRPCGKVCFGRTWQPVAHMSRAQLLAWLGY
jgi:hypothetical protein